MGRNIDQYIIPHLGAVKLETLTPLQVQELYNRLQTPDKEGVRPLSAKTIRNVHGVFHKALEQAVQAGYIRPILQAPQNRPRRPSRRSDH